MPSEQNTHGERNVVSDDAIRSHVARVLRGRTFAGSPMLSRLLQYLVDRTLDGDTGQLKEYSVGVEVFGRGADFDPRTDTIVRVQARRLRSKLEDYYRTEGGLEAIILEVPKGRYAVQWRLSDSNRAPREPHSKDSAGLSSDRTPAPSTAEPLERETELASIVVLPFVNMSGDTAKDYFSDGLTEEIISALAAVPELRVVARTSSFQFKGRAEDIRKIGRDLGVRTALEGSVRQEGSRIRATAQLIDVANGFHLWSKGYDRELTGVFSIQEEITQAIVTALRVQLTGTAPAVVPSSEAYEWYLRGRYFYHKATPPSLEESAACMERAIDCDESYAAAFAGLADACITWMTLAVERSPVELVAKARHAAGRALELDPRSAEAHCSLGEVLAVADWDFTAAEREYQQAIELKPSFVHARMAYSVTCLSPKRRHAEAIAQIREALRADPMSVLLRTTLGQAFVVAGDPDRAVGELHRALELEPSYLFAQYTLALAHVARSDLHHALDVLLGIADSAGASNCAGHLGYTRARLGDRKDAERLLHELIERDWVPSVDVAAIYNGLGDARKAIEWLKRARDNREFDALFIRDDPRFRNLMTDSRLRRAYGW